MDKIAESWEKRYANGATNAFEHDRREILALVAAAKSQAKAQKASVDYQQLRYNIDEYLRTNGDEYWRELFTPLLAGVVGDQGKEWASVLGMQFDVRNIEAELWFQDYVLTFAQPITTTTSDALHGVLAQAMEEGWAIPTIQTRIEQMFNQWIAGGATAEEFEWLEARLPQQRTELIARTETMRASNTGSYNLMDSWGVAYKGWLSTPDSRVRETHSSAGARYDVGGDPGIIPMRQAFNVGGYSMQYPGDMSNGAPIGEVANCRCTLLPYTEQPEIGPEAP